MIMRKISAALFLLSVVFATPSYAAKYSRIEILPYADNSRVPKIALKVDLFGGAKTYWRMAGETGEGPKFNWQESENIEDFKVSFPVPKRFDYMGIENFGYDDDVVFPVDIKLKDVSKDTVLRLNAEILVCKDLCIPEYHKIEVTLGDHINRYMEVKKYLEKIPEKLDKENLKASWLSVEGTDIFVNLKLSDVAGLDEGFDLFLENKALSILDKPDIKINPSGEVDVKAKLRYVYDIDSAKKALDNQIVTFTFSNEKRGYELTSIFVDNENGNFHSYNLVRIKLLLLAFIGGLILNLMPCVLPVLSIKILSILKYGGKSASKGEILKNFIATSLGIISSFWLVAVGLSILRYTGQVVGWGIQFQYPPFLMFLIVVLVFFAANLWGVFDIILPKSINNKINAFDKDGVYESFITGVFATLLATPCSAPFLGTAVAFALSGNYIDIFLIFTFMGIGLAFPYIILAFSPELFKFLPKPGAWMQKLKKILAVIVLLTAIWLMSVLYSINNQKVINDDWNKFDYSLIEKSVEEGKTVFVDITAKWCLTCKANKKFVLETAEIKQALEKENIVKLQGDWTSKDDYISAYLKNHNRFGVPFNIIYSSKYPEGYILPELLTKQIVLDALDKVK